MCKYIYIRFFCNRACPFFFLFFFTASNLGEFTQFYLLHNTPHHAVSPVSCGGRNTKPVIIVVCIVYPTQNNWLLTVSRFVDALVTTWTSCRCTRGGLCLPARTSCWPRWLGRSCGLVPLWNTSAPSTQRFTTWNNAVVLAMRGWRRPWVKKIEEMLVNRGEVYDSEVTWNSFLCVFHISCNECIFLQHLWWIRGWISMRYLDLQVV